MRRESLIPTRLVAARASPATCAAAAGSRRTVSASHFVTCATRVSGGFTGRVSSFGSVRVRGMGRKVARL